MIQERWYELQERIRQACLRSERDPKDVEVVAVTKYVSLETTREALDTGIIHIGESRVQDAIPKWQQLGDRGKWHFIGHLQTNKVKDVIGRFHYIHSLDRISLAKEIHKRSQNHRPVPLCFIQVNVSGEESKYGIQPSDLIPFAKEISQYGSIEVCGLMTMAPFTEDPEEARPVFRELRLLRDELLKLKLPHINPYHLSMGMSNDFEVAIEEGATFIRIGTSLVGKELD
ncbi:YggS family pyridoxal phosphate-dependent enzyme [Microaerobacter geothermalis]|uniref:YggS family pyridoxal phosphate-dependent enzyme n=1 Tax=Microaerobacter geothermalis TaxID=674972 RepID=UPI001F2EE903|nr:YggS family pyridoxal phosphate-dependent enzyme [Microaerobacter geothermalis]MCF6094739.1 YggS family pyridoxal phosphate-dependent enzyme [Microaerobacter geothermalis]